MKKLNSGLAWLRAALLDLLTNPGVFVWAAFTVTGMFTPGRLGWWRGVIERNVILPWGLALGLVRLYRAKQAGQIRRDVLALFVLLLWLIVPFAARFGATDANVGSWQNHAAVFFGIYAMTAEADTDRALRHLRITTALFALTSAVFAGALLYCAVTVRGSGSGAEFGFGVFAFRQLCAAQHYNATGMLALCGLFLCLAGAALCRSTIGRLVHLIPAVMTALVVVLSQSRTARYSMLFGLALGVYGTVVCGQKSVRALKRHAAGVLAGVAVFIVGYAAASGLTDAALAHYARVQAARVPAVTAEVNTLEKKGDETQTAARENKTAPIAAKRARGLGDATFTGRTDVWKNIFAMWKANPKYFLIGNGSGRTNRDILIGTPLENGGANMAHNAFIQFTMDYGLCGMLLLVLFALTVFAPVCRAFFARGAGSLAGRCMCMLIAACMLTAMMEIEPLMAMRPCNVVLFYALACAVRAGTKEA